VRDRAGFKKDGRFYVYPEIFRDEVCRGYDWRSLAKALIERGLLLRDEPSLQHKVRNLEGKSVWMFCFSEHITGEASDASDAGNGRPDQTEDRINGADAEDTF
jgi:hypothetical protein